MKNRFYFVVLAVFLLLPGVVWSGNQPDIGKNLPVIVESLGPDHFTPLDDGEIAKIRGQAQYVLVKVIGLNTLDYGLVAWTWNPLGYRYGNYGGYNWSGGDPVDAMDRCFQTHDGVYDSTNDPSLRFKADQELLAALAGLHNTNHEFWGPVYVSDVGQSNIHVYGLSLVGGKVFRGWKEMPYSEYSRREAMWGVYFMILGKHLLRLN